jgi:hypothetical protein
VARAIRAYAKFVVSVIFSHRNIISADEIVKYASGMDVIGVDPAGEIFSVARSDVTNVGSALIVTG